MKLPKTVIDIDPHKWLWEYPLSEYPKKGKGLTRGRVKYLRSKVMKGKGSYANFKNRRRK